MFNDDDKKQGTLIFNTPDGLTPAIPINKDTSLADIMVMKEMLGDKDNISAVMIDNELKWVK